ncbi:rifin [Plasmodium reichenowi]|uniref:Rifin n=1 Tax=Plasmodium reichenowi TaxID=5854 RepID=A0A060RLV9_PLARE|nr:rifin [Plasmodium reichenowi]
MKLHYSKILLFVIVLNILAHNNNNNNEPYITPRHTQTNRSLCECDTQSSNYDNDPQMKKVMKKFQDRTSERLREYDERMQEKRQQHKEKRDKNIREIIEKDKMDKSLAEKVEIGCLRCGCGLGGVAASVGLFGGLGTYGWKSAAITAAIAEVTAKGLDAGAKEGVKALIKGLEETFHIKELNGVSLNEFITRETYNDVALISKYVELQYQSCFETGSSCGHNLEFDFYIRMGRDQGTGNVVNGAKTLVQEAVDKASKETIRFTESQMETLKTGELAEIAETSYGSYSAIGYSVLAILIIVLIMVIIYLILRYRRKKKMKKKAQYTKLLNQ